MNQGAELSGGICEMKSAPGKGAQVRVRWPVSLRDIGFGRAVLLEPETRAVQELDLSDYEKSPDLKMPHKLSAGVACVRSIKSDA